MLDVSKKKIILNLDKANGYGPMVFVSRRRSNNGHSVSAAKGRA